jgi:hypothetical protein
MIEENKAYATISEDHHKYEMDFIITEHEKQMVTLQEEHK